MPQAPTKRHSPASVTSFQLGTLRPTIPNQNGTSTVCSAILPAFAAISRKSSVGTPAWKKAQNRMKIPNRKPKSPMRFTMKAFWPHTALWSSRYQKPISR